MRLAEIFESLNRNPDDSAALKALDLCLRDEVPELAEYYQEFQPACYAALTLVLLRKTHITLGIGRLAAAQVCARHGIDGQLQPVSCDLLSALAADQMACLVLEETVNTSLELERLLTDARSFLLHLYPDGQPLLSRLRPLIVAMAHQAFNNEFVWAVTDDEEAAVTALGEELGRAFQAGQVGLAELPMLLYAMYRSLSAHPAAALLVATPLSQFTGDLHSLLARALHQPRREEELRATVPMLEEVQDPVSRLVRGQYEENPYPRWLRFTGSLKTTLVRIRRVRPGFDWPEAFRGQQLQVLVAGCGTGQHSLSVALGNPEAKILALDLSTASLAYAMRMTEQHGVRNISFLHADLLSLPKLGRKFHHIECVGTLHHISERERAVAWAALVGCLHPGGTLKIGVYSKAARLLVAHLRAGIQRDGINGTAFEIRRFRAQLMEDAASAKLLARLARSSDFFSLSAVRDLLFHVQEYQYTVAEIEGITRGLGLELLGVAIPRSLARARTPDRDGRVTVETFEQWRACEMAYVGSLKMFQFYLQKPVRTPPETAPHRA